MNFGRKLPKLGLFTELRGIGILRTSHNSRSANFAVTEFSQVREFGVSRLLFVKLRC